MMWSARARDLVGGCDSNGDGTESGMSTLTLQVTDVDSDIVLEVTAEERRVFLEDTLPEAADNVRLGAEQAAQACDHASHLRDPLQHSGPLTGRLAEHDRIEGALRGGADAQAIGDELPAGRGQVLQLDAVFADENLALEGLLNGRQEAPREGPRKGRRQRDRRQGPQSRHAPDTLDRGTLDA